jgi:hypothetical protein
MRGIRRISRILAETTTLNSLTMKSILSGLAILASQILTGQIEIDRSVHLTGGTGNSSITGLADAPVADSDAVNKAYVDAAVSATGGGSGLPSLGDNGYPTMMSTYSSGNYGVIGSLHYCRNLVEGGYSDWRMPTVAEAYYLYSKDELFAGIPGAMDNIYFNAYLNHVTGANSFSIMFINMSTGDQGFGNPYSTYYRARCVR